MMTSIGQGHGRLAVVSGIAGAAVLALGFRLASDVLAASAALIAAGCILVLWRAHLHLSAQIRAALCDAEGIAGCAAGSTRLGPDAALKRIGLMVRLMNASRNNGADPAGPPSPVPADRISVPSPADPPPDPLPLDVLPAPYVTGPVAVAPDPLAPLLRLIARGDLAAARTTAEAHPGPRQDAALAALARLVQPLTQIVQGTGQASQHVRRISLAQMGLADRAGQMTASVSQAAERIADQVTRAAAMLESGDTARQAVIAARGQADHSTEILHEASLRMNGIRASGQRIAAFVKIIDGIAFQTNLLALNAGVEAARAGPEGRGFAVVAAEVRALARRASDAAREIGHLIDVSAAEVDEGVAMVSRIEDALGGIVQSIAQAGLAVQKLAETAGIQHDDLRAASAALADDRQHLHRCHADLEALHISAQALTRDLDGVSAAAGQFVLPVRARPRGLTPGGSTQPAPGPPALPARAVHSSLRVGADHVGDAVPTAPAAPAQPVTPGEWQDF